MPTFEEKLNAACFNSMVSFALALAKDSAVLQALLDGENPLTAQQIADDKKLKERYVREILNSLATAELIHVSKSDNGVLVYHLEADEKKLLKSSLLPSISFTTMLASLYDQMKAIIQIDGPAGIRYSDDVHEVMDEWSVYQTDNHVKCILENVPGLKDKLQAGIDVIEFGCGRGRLIAKLASMFPKSRFVASDVLQPLLDKTKEMWAHISNLSYQCHNLCSLPEIPEKQYDWILCNDVIHDLPKPLVAVKGIRKYLKEPDGTFAFIDMATSGSPIEDKGNMEVASNYVASAFLCVPESFQDKDSVALGACCGKQTIIDLATSAGFRVQCVMIGNCSALFICKF